VQHPPEAELALLALGEQEPSTVAHVELCRVCQREVAAFAATVATARSAGPEQLEPPPPSVWARVQEELGLAEPSVAPARATTSSWRRPRVAVAVLAAAAVAVLGVGLSGVLPGGDDGPGPVDGPSSPLRALGPVAASGEVVLAAGADGRSLHVDTRGLPRPDGLYEVWLVDLAAGRVVALGTLDDAGQAELSVPAGVDLSDYPEVDVSLEPDDGDPQHSGDSVLRGDLPA
jgi:anti-sigma-K factor RskA